MVRAQLRGRGVALAERRRRRAAARVALVHAGAWLWFAAVCQLLLWLG